MFHALKAAPSWSYHVFNPNIVATGWKEAKITGHFLLGDIQQSNWAWALSTTPCLLSAGAIVRGFGLPLPGDALERLAAGVVRHRHDCHADNELECRIGAPYLLPVLMVYLALVLLAERQPKLKPAVYVILYGNSLLQAGLFLSFVSGNWTG